jgi:alcohol dehydrogenase
MKAIELEKAGTPLKVVDRPIPTPRPDGVVIRMKSAPVLSYMHGVITGKLPYMLPAKAFIPGSDAIGIVESVGAEVFDLPPGTLVHAGPRTASRGLYQQSDQILIGLTGMSPESARVQDIWTDGAYAEYVHYPADAVTPLIGLSHIDFDRLGAIMFLAVPYKGLLSMNLKPAETVIIGGATGNFGAHGVMMALAMGAGRIVPTGRNTEVLEKIKAISPKRIFPATLSGDLEQDTKAIITAAEAPADCFLDIVGGGGTGSVLAAIRSLRNGGRVTLMGALEEVIQIQYVEIMVRELTIRGNFMYPPTAVGDIAKIIASKLIDLDLIDVKSYLMLEAADAIENASTKGGLSFNVLLNEDKPLINGDDAHIDRLWNIEKGEDCKKQSSPLLLNRELEDSQIVPHNISSGRLLLLMTTHRII